MEKKLKILMVEDLPSDAELIKREIKKNGIQFIAHIVETKENYIKAIQNFKPDIILSDYNLPSFDGMQAILIREELAPAIPFILITGSLNEETAVEIMKAGADDYVIKEHITRVGTAIKTAIEKKEILSSKKESEAKLRILSRAMEQNPASIMITDIDGNIEYVNPKFTSLTGYSLDEVTGKNPRILKSGVTSPDDYNRLWKTITTGSEWHGEFQNRKKNGEIYFESVSISPIKDEKGIITHFLAVKEDITDRKLSEEALVSERALLKTLIDNLPSGIFIKDKYFRKIVANKLHISSMARHLSNLGINPETDIIGKTDFEVVPKDLAEEYYKDDEKVIRFGHSIINKEEIGFGPDGKQIWLLVSKIPLLDKDGSIDGLIGITTDITDRKQAIKELAWEQFLMHSLLENIPDAIYFKDMESRFLRINKAMANLFGLDNPLAALGKTDNDFFKSEHSQQAYYDEQEIIHTGKPIINKEEMETWPDRPPSWVSTTKMPLIDDNGEIIGTFGISRNITDHKRAEDALKESEFFFKESQRAAFIGSYKTNFITGFWESSEILDLIFGIDQNFTKDIPGWLSIIHPDDKEMMDSYIRNDVIGNSKPFNKEYRIIRKSDNEVRWVFGLGELSFDKNGNVVSLFGTIQDITERKQAEIQIKTLSKAIEQSHSSIIITNADGNIEFVNAKFTSFMQYSLNEVIGKNPRIFNPGHTAHDKHEVMWNTLQSGSIWQDEFRNRKKDGTEFWENVIISPLIGENGKISNYILIMEDITDKKKMLDELIKAKDKAEESDRLKTSFLHNISHEIRTPLNAIVGFCALLTDPALLPEKRQYFSDVIIKSSDQLLTIITDIINISTIESGQERILEKDVNLNSRFKKLYEQFVSKATNLNIEFRYNITLADNEAIVRLDETKLLQVLNNLLDNAFKFTKQGHINFGYNLKNNFIEFYVEDSGIGIHPSMHQEIFKRFRQVESTSTRQYGGSGLGLSISKAYVGLLGGQMWLSSELDKGSVFYFTVPYKISDVNILSGKPTINNYKIEPGKPLTILVAEDEDFNYMLIEEFLSDMKFTIIRAINGLMAVDISKSNLQIDLVLMDLKMPVLDGYNATKQIKKIRPDLKIIAITAYSTQVDINNAIICGCCDYIIKPIQQEILISKIKEHIVKA